MSRLTTESQEVWAPVLYGIGGSEEEIAEYYDEEDAVIRAQEEIGKYIAKTGEYCYCVIEHRVVPIYK